MRVRLPLLATAAVLLAAPANLRAQDNSVANYDRSRPANFLGGSLTVAWPTGEFGNRVERGGGDLHYIRALDSEGLLALRVDAGLLIHDEESDVGSSSDKVAWVGVGPQIGVPDGRLRPYVNAYVGYAHNDDPNITESRGFSYGAGVGMYVPVRQASPVNIDLGVRYHNHGETEYLYDDIRVDDETNLLTLYVGVSVGISR